jgi:hypothetical protein
MLNVNEYLVSPNKPEFEYVRVDEWTPEVLAVLFGSDVEGCARDLAALVINTESEAA